MKRRKNGLFRAFLGLCVVGLSLVSSAAEQLTYVQNANKYTHGTVDLANLSQSMVVSGTTATLAFPGFTLNQIASENWDIYGYFCGGSVAANYRGARSEMFCVQTHKDTAGDIDKMIGNVVMYESPYMKCVVLEFTNGTDGVYVRQIKALYKRNETYKKFAFSTLQEDGSVTYSTLASVSTVATGFASGGYGVCGLTLLKTPVPDERTCVWKNESGMPILTLDALRNYQFQAVITGAAVANSGTTCDGYNTVMTWNADRTALTAIRTEFQLLDDKYIKCVVVEFTNGADGIEMRALAARYILLSTGGLGFHFVNEDGTFAGNSSVVSANSWNSYYCVYELTAIPLPEQIEFVLNADKTWSELIGDTDLGTRDQIVSIRVEGEHPTLTFDTSLDRSEINFTGTTGTASFALAFIPSFSGTFTVDSLGVGEGLTADVPLAYEPTEIQLGLDSTVRYSVSGEAAVHSAIHGAGGVEIVAGTFTFTKTSDYTGGTLVRSGATIKPGLRSTSAGGILRVGAFGSSDQGSRIKLEPGAHFDYAGFPDVNYHFEMEGADPIFNSKPEENFLDYHKSQALGFILSNDLVLNMTNALSMYSIVTPSYGNPGLIALNGHTLVKNGTNTLSVWSKPLTIRDKGLIALNEGTISFGKGQATGWNAAIAIAPGAILESRHNLCVGSITNNGTIVLAPYDASVTTNHFACRGQGIVRKVGSGIARASFFNGSRWLYQVESGTLQVQRCEVVSGNPYDFITPENPTANHHVVVGSGATFDLADAKDLSVSVTLSGTGVDGLGALVNSSANDIVNYHFQTVQLKLAADASVGGVSDFGLVAPSFKPTRLELGTNTLTLAKDGCFWLVNSTVTGTGTLCVDRGILCACHVKSTGEDFTLDIGADGQVSNLVEMTMGRLRAAGPFKTTAAVTVKHEVEAAGGAIERLTLEDGATIRVTDGTKPLTVTQALTLGSTVVLDVNGVTLGDRSAVPLIVPPTDWTDTSVVYKVKNVKPGHAVTVRRNGVPVLVQSGLTLMIR